MNDTHGDSPGWFERRENIEKLWYGLLILTGALVVAGLVFTQQPHFAIESVPGFFAIFGFLAFVVIIFIGRLLRTVIMRDEDYYERD